MEKILRGFAVFQYFGFSSGFRLLPEGQSEEERKTIVSVFNLEVDCRCDNCHLILPHQIAIAQLQGWGADICQ